MEKDLKKQIEIVCQGAEDILLKDELIGLLSQSIKENKPLKVKLGLDPTAPDIHLGHTVVLNKLRQFQDLGHKAILIIGDYTARIGDPSGRSTLRPKLNPEIIDKNAKTYIEQAFKILLPQRTEIVRNSKWLKPLKLEDILNLTSRFTVARMLERDDFKKRFSTNIPIVIMEFLYPLMQAYDSVAIEADIELGGTDQRFNLLVGRELQKEFGQKPQIAITMPILVGIDGLEKMSKSLGNYIGVTEPPEEIFGKVMSIPDSIIIDYYRLLTRLAKSQIDEIERDMTHKGQNPVYVKRRLARLIVESLHNAEKATCAEKHFDSIFKEKKTPEQVQEYKLDNSDIKAGKVWLVGLLVKCKLAASNGEARRLISQGAIKIGGNKVDDVNSEIDVNYVDGKVIQKGKRHFRRISIN
jgi:tyrosyl-tRNA synthetase